MNSRNSLELKQQLSNFLIDGKASGKALYCTSVKQSKWKTKHFESGSLEIYTLNDEIISPPYRYSTFQQIFHILNYILK